MRFIKVWKKSMQYTNKAETFIGFSTRCGKIVFGIEQIERLKRAPKLMILCSTIGENSRKKSLLYAERKNVKVLVLSQRILGDIVGKDNCKVIGLTDTHLAQAIIDNSQGWADSPKVGV